MATQRTIFSTHSPPCCLTLRWTLRLNPVSSVEGCFRRPHVRWRLELPAQWHMLHQLSTEIFSPKRLNKLYAVAEMLPSALRRSHDLNAFGSLHVLVANLQTTWHTMLTMTISTALWCNCLRKESKAAHPCVSVEVLTCMTYKQLTTPCTRPKKSTQHHNITKFVSPTRPTIKHNENDPTH